MADNPSNIVPDNLIVIEGGKQLVPAPAPSDAGKVLGVVNASGDIGWVEDQSGTLTQVQADWAETDPSKVSFIDNKPSIPSKTSDLQNDSGFITSSDIPAIPTKTSDLQNDSGFITSSDVPTKTSELQNDSGFITSADVPAQVQANWNETSTGAASYIQNKPSIPSKTSDLQNDSGFITSSDIPAQVQSDWNETNTSSAAYIQNKPTIPPGVTVDQTYNASSTNAQSGVAVAEAIATIPVAPTYSEGDGIDITNNVISADVDEVTIGIDSTTHKIKSLQTIPTKTSDLQNDSGFITSSDIPAQVQANWNESNSSSAAYIQNKPTIPTVDQTYNASSTNAQSGVAVASAVAGVNAVPASTSADEDKVLTVNSSGTPVWAASAVPASKPLVQGSGITITDGQNDVTISANADQTYSASSTNAQSGVAVASAIAGISQVPASTSADEDKVLTVNSSGTPVWAAAQGGGGSSTVVMNLDDNAYWEAILRSRIGADTSDLIFIAYFEDRSYDPSSVTAVTSRYTVTRLAEYTENIWEFKWTNTNQEQFYISTTSIITKYYKILALAYGVPSGVNWVCLLDGNNYQTNYCRTVGNIFPNPNKPEITIPASTANCGIAVNKSTRVSKIGSVDLSLFKVPNSAYFGIWFGGETGYSVYTYEIGDIYLNSSNGNNSRLDFSYAFKGLPIQKAPRILNRYSGLPMSVSRAYLQSAFESCAYLKECDWVIELKSWKPGTYVPDSDHGCSCKNMFKNCVALTKAPTVAYADMVRAFSTSSDVTAYTMGVNLSSMFEGCSALQHVPVATPVAKTTQEVTSSTPYVSYLEMNSMYKNSGLIEHPVMLVTTDEGPRCAEAFAASSSSEFEGCTGLRIVPTSGWSSSYSTHGDIASMFKDATQVDNSASIYASLSASTGSGTVTTNAFSGTGSMTANYSTQSAQIPSSWGGTGA